MDVNYPADVFRIEVGGNLVLLSLSYQRESFKKYAIEV